MTTVARTFIPRTQLESQAAELLERHGLLSFPVNPVSVANSEGIEVFSIDFRDDSVSGILRKEDGAYRIYVNSNHSNNRKRYTIAHEIGHYVLHRDDVAAFVDPELNLYRSKDSRGEVGSQGDMEIQANIFASALLMPAELVETAYGKCRDVAALARLFLVSSEAMGHRIVHLDL